MSTDPDLAIVADVLAGDADAFDELVRRYQRQILALVSRLVGAAAEAPDIAQKVFMNAYTKLGSFRRKSSFKTWLYAIAINQSRNALRRRRRRGISVDVEELDPGVEQEVEDELVERQRKRRVREALDRLPPKQRGVLMLRVYEEMAFAEIAGAMGMSENSAKVNFHHAVKRLRGLLRTTEHPASVNE